jgi:hypothetical protein
VSDAAEVRGLHAPAGVGPARRALLAWVDDAGAAGRVFLQARLLRTPDGRYEVRHRDDAGLADAELTAFADPMDARSISQTTAEGAHRPLKTAPSLARGWRIAGLDGAGLWMALEYLYPAAAVHWHAGREGTLRVTHWAETAGRQSGIYASVRLLPPEVVRNTVRACCGDAVCLRRVAWEVDAGTPLALPHEAPPDGAAVLCPEACSMFVSFARAVLVMERSPQQEVPLLGRLRRDEVLQLREVATAAAAGTLGEAREGEFSDAANSRRLRYLALRLADEEARAGGSQEAELPCEGCPRPVPCDGCPLV